MLECLQGFSDSAETVDGKMTNCARAVAIAEPLEYMYLCTDCEQYKRSVIHYDNEVLFKFYFNLYK